MKSYLHGDLRDAREALVWKLEGLSEYDVRRPMTPSGTNLLGMVKHVAYSSARYFGEVFDRPFADVPRWNAPGAWEGEHYATAAESREDVLALYARVAAHADETISSLELDSPGHVPWWPRPDVQLYKIIAHMLAEINRHAGHADILREQLDGGVGEWPGREGAADPEYWGVVAGGAAGFR
ncbi:MAG TPA: DinB family protein [Phytomonospora sp.]